MLDTLESGSPAKPAIVFCHGGGFGGQSWTPVIERLPEFFCLAPDLPQQGKSRGLRFTLDGAALGVAEVIRHRVPSARAHVVGLSLGGAVVQTLLRIAPELVDHAMVTGSSDRLPGWLVAISKPLLGLGRFFKPETLVRATLRQQKIPPEYHDFVHDDLINSAVDRDFLERVFSELTRFAPPASLTRPLLVCVGAKEPGASRLYGRLSLRALRRYPTAVGASVPNATHAWPLQFPDLFAKLTRAWVSDQPFPRGVIRL